MTIDSTRNNKAYGINNPLQRLNPQPIIGNRAPTINDKNFSIGQVWIDQPNDDSYTLTSVRNNQANWETTNGPTELSFEAYMTGQATSVTGDGTEYSIIFDSIIRNIGNNYNPITGIFTAPINGFYHFTGGISITDTTTAHKVGELFFVTSTNTFTIAKMNVGTVASDSLGFTELFIPFSLHTDLSASDICSIKVKVSLGAKVVNVTGSSLPTLKTYFSGVLVN